MTYRHNAHKDHDDEQIGVLDDVESMLRSTMLRKGITPKCKTFKIQLEEKCKIALLSSFDALGISISIGCWK